MACFHPMQAYQCADGSVVFAERRGMDIVRLLTLPCGQCWGCRLERSRQWAVRCMHEASLYDRNCFVTLTYADEYLPDDLSLRYPDFQKFLKRLRRRFFSSAIRFYMCGEYGESFGRPHYHACLFNFDFADKLLWSTKGGVSLYTSKALSELWPFGHSLIGAVTFESAAYVARYCMKKVTGKAAAAHYRLIDKTTGECIDRTPEFNKMSLKPGIGAPWLEKYSSDVYPRGDCVVNGRKTRPPRYYDKWYTEKGGDFGEIELKRYLAGQKAYELGECSDERLAVKERVTYERMKLYTRDLT